MRLDKIILANFRSYVKKGFELDGEINTVVGPNGAGKTNLLEAIYMLSTGRSFRADLEVEVIRYGEKLARVIGEVEGEGKVKLEVAVHDGTYGGMRKKFLVNGVLRRWQDFVGNFRAVLFGPWDLELLDGSPGKRRNYLDFVLTQVDREYRRSLVSYEKGIRQRNRVLERIRDEGGGRTQLLFWDALVIKNGNYISDKRASYCEFLNRIEGGRYKIVYDRSEISEVRLRQYVVEEVAAAATLVGPHRDDFAVQIQNTGDEADGGGLDGSRDVAKFGSRGEQRMAILWLKIGELEFVESITGARPILLLDDIFSELDHKHREMVVKMVSGQQTIITSADEHLVGGVAGGKTIVL